MYIVQAIARPGLHSERLVGRIPITEGGDLFSKKRAVCCESTNLFCKRLLDKLREPILNDAELLRRESWGAREEGTFCFVFNMVKRVLHMSVHKLLPYN